MEARYRQHIIRWFGHLEFRGLMRTPKPIVLPLEDIYVELRAVAEVPEAADAFSVEERRLLLEIEEKDDTKRRELMSQLDAFRRERWSRTIPERKSMAEALHQRDRRAFVILGDPGSGKTTLLHFLALVYAREPEETAAERLGVDLAEADRLPIFVPLAAFDDMLRESQREGGRSLTLLEFLPRYYDRRRGLPGLEPLFFRALESGRALVLLDGLDEVLDVGTRRYVAEQAGALVGEWGARGVRFALSSRFVGYREAPVPGNLPTLSVLDFGTPEIETFVRRWAHAFEKWVAQGEESPEMHQKARELEAGLLEDVRSNESVRRLAANPLMLTMLALLRRQVGRLPHRRVQLYESYVGTLLENWVDARSEGARERSIAILDRHQAESILIPLAFWLQKEKPSGTAGRAEIKGKLVEICLKERGSDPAQAERLAVREAEKEADRFLQEMRQMAGLIIERGHDAFGFLHLTFQEYFAGRALAQLGDDERWKAIRPNLHDPRWREPILLCAGRLGVVENRRAQVTQLVRSILDNDDPTEADLHRNLLCALTIACDDVRLEPGLATELVERASAHLSTLIPALARELLRLLAQLVANGMVGLKVCLAAVESSDNHLLKVIAVEEFGRFADLPDVDRWLRSQLDSSNGQVAKAALDALAPQMGKDRLLWKKAIDSLGTWGAESTVRSLSALARDNVEVRRALLDQLPSNNSTVLTYVLTALAGSARSDAEVRKLFIEGLGDSNLMIRIYSVYGLADLIGEDEEVRRAVLRKLDDTPSSVRLASLHVLGNWVTPDNDVRQAVLDKLNDKRQTVRVSAARALSNIFDSDQEALEKVISLLDREKSLDQILDLLKVDLLMKPEVHRAFLGYLNVPIWRVRQSSCRGLMESGVASRDNLFTVLRIRDCSESSELLQWCASLSETRQDERWLSFWREKLSTSNVMMHGPALIALADADPMSDEVRRVALEQMKAEDSEVRRFAVSAISRWVGLDGEVRSAIVKALDDWSWEVSQSALSALSDLVETSEEVRGMFLNRLEDVDLKSRCQALLGLSSVTTDREIRHAVLQRLGDGSEVVRQVALMALSEGVGIEEVRRAVLDRLSDSVDGVRQTAVAALAKAVRIDVDVRCAVFACLEDENENMRQAAVSSVSELIGENQEAYRLILGRMDDESAMVRQSAVKALSSLLETAPPLRQAVLQKLDDAHFAVRLQVVEAVAECPESSLFEEVHSRLLPWLGVDGYSVHPDFFDSQWMRSIQAKLARRVGSKLQADVSLRSNLLEMLGNPRWSARLGAALALLAWPGGPPDDVMERVLAALDDPRGLEPYPAQLTAASYLINQNDAAAEAVDLCLEALAYGTQPWESLYYSRDVRKQAALVLGKLEPVFFHDRVYDKLLHVLHNDEDPNVRDAAYGTLVRLARIREQQTVA